MLPAKIGDFSLQTHVLSLNEEEKKIHIQYRDKKYRTYTAVSTHIGIAIHFTDPEQEKLLWMDTSDSLKEAVELVKMHCSNHSQEALYQHLYSIKERHEQQKFKEFMSNVVQKSIAENIDQVGYEELWKIMNILKKDYRLYDYLDQTNPENKVTNT